MPKRYRSLVANVNPYCELRELWRGCAGKYWIDVFFFIVVLPLTTLAAVFEPLEMWDFQRFSVLLIYWTSAKILSALKMRGKKF
jgi:predicted cation transporter